jgi:hypothetical protein
MDAVAKARHDLRGKINTLKLSLSALEIEKDPTEQAEWLRHIMVASEKAVIALDALEQAQPEAPETEKVSANPAP